MKLNKHKLISLIEHFQEIKEIQEKKLVLVTETMKKIESDLDFLMDLYNKVKNSEALALYFLDPNFDEIQLGYFDTKEEAQAYLDELYQLLNPDKINENRIFQKIEAAK